MFGCRDTPTWNSESLLKQIINSPNQMLSSPSEPHKQPFHKMWVKWFRHTCKESTGGRREVRCLGSSGRLSLHAVVAGMAVWVLGNILGYSMWVPELKMWAPGDYLGSLGCSGMMVFALSTHSESEKVCFLLRVAV